ncbi:MAG: hypothetical protein HY819_10885 [Acidobacteria bacterium]|nr:hypothetical protein [Acidobacteriota bacterium]
MQNLRVNPLNTEYFNDFDFNIEDIKKILAPQIDSDTNNDETIPIAPNDNSTENNPTENDTNEHGNISSSRKTWCC